MALGWFKIFNLLIGLRHSIFGHHFDAQTLLYLHILTPLPTNGAVNQSQQIDTSPLLMVFLKVSQ